MFHLPAEFSVFSFHDIVGDEMTVGNPLVSAVVWCPITGLFGPHLSSLYSRSIPDTKRRIT